MSLPDRIAIRCDICGWINNVPEDQDTDRSRQGYPEPLWPLEWGTVTVRNRRSAGTVLELDACTACMKKVPDAIRKVDETPIKSLDDRSDNFDLSQVGQAVQVIIPVPVGDLIDRGQLLVKELARRGYGIFKQPIDGSK